jgi:hypothetical protein
MTSTYSKSPTSWDPFSMEWTMFYIRRIGDANYINNHKTREALM